MKWFLKFFVLTLLFAFIHAQLDEYGRVLSKEALKTIAKNIATIIKGLDDKIGDDALLKKIMGFKFIQETYIHMPKRMINRLWMESASIDKMFVFLKPKTLWFVYHNRIFIKSMKKRKNQYPKVVEMIEHYRYGRIDDEGNWSEEKKQKKQSTTTTTTTTATSTATPKQTEANDGKFENPYRIVTTPPPTQPEIGINDTTSRAPSVEDPHGNIPPPAFPADPGPFTEGIRLLLFKTMPDLHPIVVNTLSAFDWTFAEYVLNNAMHPGAIIQAMTSDTLKWVTEHVANFPEILAGSDGQTVYNFFGKVPYPCQFFQSLAKSIRDQLVFKNNWLQYCEPIPVKTTAVPIHTTPQPLFNEEIIGIIRKKIPNFSLLLEIVPFEKFQSNNPKAIALFKLIQNISDEDAKKANKLFNQLTAKMTRQEAADIFLNGIREFAGSLTVYEFILS